jgi:putative peptidoglycan lipid II flippase
MQNATTLIQFPLGLVVTAISMAVLPSLARLSVSRGECSVESQVELGDFRRTLATGLRMVLVLIVPATVGLGVLARPIVQLLFEHGAFTANDTAMTVLALDFYLIGLPFAAIDQPLVYAFYARKDTVTPVLVGVMAIGVYTVVALALIGPLGMTGLVLANSAQWFSHAVVMVTLLHRRLDGLRGQRLELAAAKALAASAAMAIAVWAALAWVQGVVAGEGLAAKATRLGVAGLVAFAVYAAALVVLRVDEVRFIREAVARRLDAGRGIGV